MLLTVSVVVYLFCLEIMATDRQLAQELSFDLKKFEQSSRRQSMHVLWGGEEIWHTDFLCCQTYSFSVNEVKISLCGHALTPRFPFVSVLFF